MKKTEQPKQLSEEATEWWEKLKSEYRISDEGGLLLLQTAMEAFDKMRRAQTVIAADGDTFIDRFKQPRCHPMHAVERDARGQMLAALKALHLDVEPQKAGAVLPLGGSVQKLNR